MISICIDAWGPCHCYVLLLQEAGLACTGVYTVVGDIPLHMCRL